MGGVETLAGSRPPWSSLLGAAIRIGAIALIVIAFRAAVPHPTFFSRDEGPLFWIRVALFGGLALAGLWMLRDVVRVALRWVRGGFGVTVASGHLTFRLPHARYWFQVPRVVETTVALEDVRSTRFVTSRRAALLVETAGPTIAIAPGTFAVGGYTLDARIRAHAPPGAFPHPMAAVPAYEAWTASRAARLTMFPLGVALFFAPLALVLIDKELVRSSFAFLLASFALLGTATLYRGSITLDERGFFFERGGTVSFIAWPDLARGKVQYAGNAIGLLRSLVLESVEPTRGGRCRVGLNQVFLLGYPVKKIAAAVRNRMDAHR